MVKTYLFCCKWYVQMFYLMLSYPIYCFFVGIEGAFSEPGSKTVIPKKVVGKFSIRLVPSQEPNEVISLVKKHLADVHSKSGSPNAIKLVSGFVSDPFTFAFT